MRPVSKKRAALMRIYVKRRDEYLTAHPSCEVCGARPVELHHRRGRAGLDLINTSFFAALCREHHRLATEHPAWAFDCGLSVRRIGGAA